MTALKLKEYKFHQPCLNLNIEFTIQTMEEILELAFTKDRCEQGGFLIGRYSDESSAIIEGTISPKRKNSTPVSYIRFTDGMQDFWNRLYDEAGLIYLGEWHSHPGASANYSTIDRDTMIEISEADSVKINYPLFLIIGLNKENPQIKFYTVYDKTIYEYE